MLYRWYEFSLDGGRRFLLATTTGAHVQLDMVRNIERPGSLLPACMRSIRHRTRSRRIFGGTLTPREVSVELDRADGVMG